MGPEYTQELFETIHFNEAHNLHNILHSPRIDVNATDKDGWSLLHKAAQLGRPE